MSWFKKHDYPDFWNNYINCFKHSTSQKISDTRFVVFDTETTGLQIKKDRILSIGTIAIVGETIKVSDQLEIYLEQELFNSETVKIHGLLKSGSIKKINETEAIKYFLDHIQNAVLVAHHAAFDISMINAALHRINLPKLKNKVIDTGYLFKCSKLNMNNNSHVSLDELSNRFNIPLHDRHTASGDAYITALLFLKLVSILKQNNPDLKLNDILKPKQRIGLL